MNKSQLKKRVLAGMRATGNLHLGNYLGAAKGMLALQDNPDYETLYMVADMHAITTPFDPKSLKNSRRSVILDYLSVGLDPKRSILFFQSDIMLHAELANYMSSVMTVSRMQHLPTFKEKIKQYPENNTMALLNYPILMAADILIYKAHRVPVGIDQEPHLEVAREVARKMNATYDLDFPEPKRFATAGEYVPSLSGQGKMSKSVEGSYINLMDDLKTIKQRIAKVPTDSGKGSTVPTQGGVASLLVLVELFIGKRRRKEVENQYTTAGVRYGDLKAELSQAIYTELKPIQTTRKQLEAKPRYVDTVIKEGAHKARAIAQQTLLQVREVMGLY